MGIKLCLHQFKDFFFQLVIPKNILLIYPTKSSMIIRKNDKRLVRQRTYPIRLPNIPINNKKRFWRFLCLHRKVIFSDVLTNLQISHWKEEKPWSTNNLGNKCLRYLNLWWSNLKCHNITSSSFYNKRFREWNYLAGLVSSSRSTFKVV